MDKVNRALNDIIYGYGYSVETCYTACSNYKYFAIQAGTWCVCEDSFDEATQYGTTTTCSNGIGAAWSNALYISMLLSYLLFIYNFIH